MPIHDWTRVDAAYFHSFYLSWVSALSGGLNKGILPSSHYALTENQRDGRVPTFVELAEPSTPWTDPGDAGGTRYADDAPPRTLFHELCTHPEYAEKVITVRRSDFHQVVAAIRIVAPDAKRSRYRLDQLVAWVVEVLRQGASVLIVDLFRPGPHDSQGIHKAIWDEFIDNDFLLPSNMPLTLASYVAKPFPEAYVEPTAVGRDLSDMPLFLEPGVYVEVPLAITYGRTFDAEPKHLRELLTRE
jgi:hypothetical protein